MHVRHEPRGHVSRGEARPSLYVSGDRLRREGTPRLQAPSGALQDAGDARFAKQGLHDARRWGRGEYSGGPQTLTVASDSGAEGVCHRSPDAQTHQPQRVCKRTLERRTGGHCSLGTTRCRAGSRPQEKREWVLVDMRSSLDPRVLPAVGSTLPGSLGKVRVRPPRPSHDATSTCNPATCQAQQERCRQHAGNRCCQLKSTVTLQPSRQTVTSNMK